MLKPFIDPPSFNFTKNESFLNSNIFESMRSSRGGTARNSTGYSQVRNSRGMTTSNYHQIFSSAIKNTNSLEIVKNDILRIDTSVTDAASPKRLSLFV